MMTVYWAGKRIQHPKHGESFMTRPVELSPHRTELMEILTTSQATAASHLRF
jgi:hypothetical protein